MAYVTQEARQELLRDVAAAIDSLGTAIGAFGAAYELLDERTADVLESELFRPVQLAYGRAKKTHSGFAARYRLRDRQFQPRSSGTETSSVDELIERAVTAISEADGTIVELQDSMRPVEVGDPELRAGLAEVRTLIGNLPARARRLQRVVGR
jgi:hypothetical protein